MKKYYSLYHHTSELNLENHTYLAKYIGKAVGNIESGAFVISNSTKGSGDLIGHIAPQKNGIFNLTGDILTNPNGEKMIFQNDMGSHDLSFCSSFIEFVLETSIKNVSGRAYDGVEDHKGYVISFNNKGKEQKATITSKNWTQKSEKKKPEKSKKPENLMRLSRKQRSARIARNLNK